VVPAELPPAEEGLELGFEGGVPGGVEGGVLGGIVGGILPAPQPTPTPVAPRVVRIGGQLVAPALVRKVAPQYPELARSARVQGIVILEAQVGTRGRVKTVSVLRGHPLLDESAVEAVKQWRYRPLLLNGVPTEFILTVTITFGLR
jgi:protein TonB